MSTAPHKAKKPLDLIEIFGWKIQKNNKNPSRPIKS